MPRFLVLGAAALLCAASLAFHLVPPLLPTIGFAVVLAVLLTSARVPPDLWRNFTWPFRTAAFLLLAALIVGGTLAMARPAFAAAAGAPVAGFDIVGFVLSLGPVLAQVLIALAALDILAQRIVKLTPTKRDDELLARLQPGIDVIEKVGKQLVAQVAASAATGAASGAAAAVVADKVAHKV